MPRTARIKYANATYHIIMKSSSDLNLFRSNRDKDKFLELLKKYKEIFLFKVYSYCLMDTHIHLLIYSNGADISKFMHNINQCYAQYYNKKYNRKGHVFNNRFKSKIATTDTSIMCMSAYIHNNPKDIRGFKNCVQNYEYSSFNIYLNNYRDKYKLIDTNFILNYFHKDPILAKKHYYAFVKSRLNLDINEIKTFKLEFGYKENKYYNPNKNIYILNRDIDPTLIINYVLNYGKFKFSDLYVKFRRKSSDLKALCSFLIYCFSNYNYRQIQKILKNVSLSYIGKLCNKGYLLTKTNPNYKNIVHDFIISNFELICS